MIVMKLEKFLEFFWKEMLYLIFKIMMKPYFHLYLTFLSRQLDNDDANDDENDIDIFSRTDQARSHNEANEAVASPKISKKICLRWKIHNIFFTIYKSE